MARTNIQRRKPESRKTDSGSNRVSAAIAKFLRNPIQTSVRWFDSYFLHQSNLFYRFVMLILFMLGCGLVMVLSASNVLSVKQTGDPFSEFLSQVGFAGLGLAAMLFISKRSVAQIQSYTAAFFWTTVVLQLLVRVPGIGVSVGGNTNWIDLGIVQIQPSEFLKIGVILFLASLLSANLDYLWDFNTVAKPVLIYGFGAAGLVLVLSGDLGTAAVMGSFILVLLFLIGMPANRLMIFVGLIGVAAFVAATASINRLNRILSFFNRCDSNIEAANWQVCHGEWALASGGLFGTGLGESKMKWGWIPEVENDFIFSIVGEEVGLIGAVVVLILFFLLARYMRQISINSRTDFGSIAVTGIMLWILIQALINIAVVLHLFPVLGVPLPLFSKGGSSMLAVLMALGIVLAVERDQATAPRKVARR
jgi:cell division protein FtsW